MTTRVSCLLFGAGDKKPRCRDHIVNENGLISLGISPVMDIGRYKESLNIVAYIKVMSRYERSPTVEL